MNPYINAEGFHASAKHSFNGGFYQQTIVQATMAIELYLKSVLRRIEPTNDLNESHDIIGIHRIISKQHPSKKLLDRALRESRKYYNESRYPENPVIYTEEFANRFLDHINLVKSYVDDDCSASIDDLANQYGRK